MSDWRMETHSPSLPPLHSGDKKIRPSSYQNSLLQGMNNIDFLFRGDTHIRHNTIFFCLACRSAGSAPVTPLPPDGFVLVRWEGGLCGDFCTVGAFSVLCPAAGRFGRAHSVYWLEISFHRPVSLEDVNPLSLSLSISSSSLDPCILYYELVLPSMNLECAVLKLHTIAYN